MTPSLTVDRSQLVEALKTLNKLIAKRRDSGEAVVGYADGQLQIDLAGVTVNVAASGDWPGQARVSRVFAVNLVYGLGEADPVSFTVEEGRLHVGSLSTSCVWSDGAEPPLRLPINATLVDVLALAMNHPTEEVARAGLTKVVLDAEDKRNDLEERAAKLLAPLGVTRFGLRSLIDTCIKRAETR